MCCLDYVYDWRSALENAVAACGSDPMAGPLWDSYITLETVNVRLLTMGSARERWLD